MADLPVPVEPRLADLLREILVQVDDFERAIASARRREDYEALLSGLEAIRSGLLRSMRRQGVTRFDARGETFRPGRHELLTGDVAPEGARVTEELRSGYEWMGKVFRKAWVRVDLKEGTPSPPEGGSPPPEDPPGR